MSILPPIEDRPQVLDLMFLWGAPSGKDGTPLCADSSSEHGGRQQQDILETQSVKST